MLEAYHITQKSPVHEVRDTWQAFLGETPGHCYSYPRCFIRSFDEEKIDAALPPLRGLVCHEELDKPEPYCQVTQPNHPSRKAIAALQGDVPSQESLRDDL